jgi:hypothetical protein
MVMGRLLAVAVGTTLPHAAPHFVTALRYVDPDAG